MEEALKGEEASFLAFCAGEDYALLPSAQDHKAVGEGDAGPNTGGMGAYSPAPILPRDNMLKPLNWLSSPFSSCLPNAASLYRYPLCRAMYTETVSVLEYNVRFGDPECQRFNASGLRSGRNHAGLR